MKKGEIVRAMGRAATAAEVQKIMAEVAAIEADSARADDKMTVSCHPPTHAPSASPISDSCRACREWVGRCAL